MVGAGLLGGILLGLISEGALGGTSSGGLPFEAAGFSRSKDVSPTQGLAWRGGGEEVEPEPEPPPPDAYREDGPLSRRLRRAGGPPAWDSDPAWWLSSPSVSEELSVELLVSESCRHLLREFGEMCASLVNCTVRNARPVRICEKCILQFHSFWDTFDDISKSSGNVSCSKQLLRSDRLQIVLKMHNYLQKIWIDSQCDACLNDNKTSPSMDTVIFKKMLNDSLNCFGQYSSIYPDHGNHSDLCNKCKVSYKNLTEWYTGMANKNNLCIDIVDAMNLTRQLWSKKYNCTVPCSDTIPVIAVSTFLLFLPVIFYLSSFLHSEQKKWKLIEPKRLKPCSSAAHIE
ncbi:osteopetrosis-associated transmembrane protein 1 isoform X1 [Heptranchias perlo]|uniref:osteopetrosis-associated transmembrane protein 1 isoform X1 n=1 Tax=Heptranchias perlo TaxID=212740 RepID=UPI0035594C47